MLMLATYAANAGSAFGVTEPRADNNQVVQADHQIKENFTEVDAAKNDAMWLHGAVHGQQNPIPFIEAVRALAPDALDILIDSSISTSIMVKWGGGTVKTALNEVMSQASAKYRISRSTVLVVPTIPAPGRLEQKLAWPRFMPVSVAPTSDSSKLVPSVTTRTVTTNSSKSTPVPVVASNLLKKSPPSTPAMPNPSVIVTDAMPSATAAFVQTKAIELPDLSNTTSPKINVVKTEEKIPLVLETKPSTLVGVVNSSKFIIPADKVTTTEATIKSTAFLYSTKPQNIVEQDTDINRWWVIEQGESYSAALTTWGKKANVKIQWISSDLIAGKQSRIFGTFDEAINNALFDINKNGVKLTLKSGLSESGRAVLVTDEKLSQGDKL
jgi:hypothetical protein